MSGSSSAGSSSAGGSISPPSDVDWFKGKGLEAYHALAPAAHAALADGGFLVLELGWKSEAGAREAVTAAGFEAVEVRPDLRGIPRVLVARKEGHSPFRSKVVRS